MTTFTRYLRLIQSNFDQIPWDDDVNGNWATLDAAVGNFAAIKDLVGIWKNSTQYTVGNLVVDPDTNDFYICNIDNVSAAGPSTFSADRIARPTLWSLDRLAFCLPLSGGVLTGPLEIKTTNTGGGLVGGSYIILSSGPGSDNSLNGQTLEVPRWTMALGDDHAETGSNAGSDFALNCYDDSGAFLHTVFTIERKTGNATVAMPPIMPSLVNAADDTAASAAGVLLHQFYRTGNTVKIRIT